MRRRRSLQQRGGRLVDERSPDPESCTRGRADGALRSALSQRESREEPVVLPSDRGTPFTRHDDQRFLADPDLVSRMSAVGQCGDPAAAEGFFDLLKRERVSPRRYPTLAEARTDVFDYIERFHNPRIRQRMAAQDRKYSINLFSAVRRNGVDPRLQLVLKSHHDL